MGAAGLQRLPCPLRFARQSGQNLGQFPPEASKVKLLPQPQHTPVTGSDGRYFARHSWQQSGQCCTSSGRVKVFPQYLQVLVIIPGAACARPPAANSLLNQSSSTALPPPSRLQIRFFNMSAASSSMWIAASRTAVISS